MTNPLGYAFHGRGAASIIFPPRRGHHPGAIISGCYPDRAPLGKPLSAVSCEYIRRLPMSPAAA